ncbi:DNRLRE domain-containing protein [Sorangium sp. So ce726]|uniref:DNRLRE domain-containing protein n=1 Tax=Sorangium sp. So ce726 TaxID=3133319 RepID=UPI003F5E45EC
MSGILLSATATGVSCSSNAPDEAPYGEAKLAAEGDEPTCVTIQRGTAGAVEDLTIWENFPTWNDNTVSVRTGTLGTFGVRHGVFKFDLSPVPAGATVVSSTLRLRQIYRDDVNSSTINIHRITSAWSEATATWSSMGNGSVFDAAIASSFQSLPGSGMRSADLTALTAAWLAGSVPNHGILLEEAPVLTTEFRSSEEPQIAQRPSLEVCYTDSPSCTGTLDDGDACTTDTCDPVLGIMHTHIATDDGDPSTIDTCNPATGAVTHVACPAQDPTVATRLIDAVGCIYQGPNAPQTGVTATIDPASVAVVKGKVATRAGAPISGVEVSVLHHGAGDADSYGQVLTRADGAFELVVRGGKPLTVKYEKAGYLPVQRQVGTQWQHWSDAPDVVMVESDPVVTPVALGSTTEVQAARGSVQSDESGVRQATLLFPPGTTGTMTVPDPNGPPGATTTVALPAEVHVRATEYTVGPNGPKAMPGTLPPTSGYTYAVELGLDEAVVAGATTVEFNQPVPFYVENFLDFPVGMAVPLGYYNAQKGVWIPEDDGRIIEILDVSGGVASVDVDGDGVADGASALGELGISEDELEELALLYTAGTSLWRVQVAHFSAWDANWPFGPPGGAGGPPGGPGGGGAPGGNPDGPCQESGSIIECENQVLGERFPVSGTPFELRYQSDRTVGRREGYRLPIPLTEATVPSPLKRIEVSVAVAGRTFPTSFECPCAPNQEHIFEWDGKDAFGRVVVGKLPVTVDIGYVYDGAYAVPASTANGRSFAVASDVFITGSFSRQEVTLNRRWESTLGRAGINGSDALGNLSLSEHHSYDPNTAILYRGDGGRRTGKTLPSSLHRVAGEIPASSAASADGVNAASAYIGVPEGVAVGADGSIYYSEPWTERVRKIAPNGLVSTVAGVYNQAGYNGDSRPAAGATVRTPRNLVIGPDGSISFYELNGRRIRRISPDGIISTIAGNGIDSSNSPAPLDGTPATSGSLGGGVNSIAVGPDGSLYFALNNRVRKVTPDGIITTVAGTGASGNSVDGTPATDAQFVWITAVAAGPDGSFYLAESVGAVGANGNRIRRVGPNGILTTVAGGVRGYSAPTGDGQPATSADPGSVKAFALGPDGSIYFTTQQLGDGDYPRLRRVAPDGIITTLAGATALRPSACFTAHCGLNGPATKVWLLRTNGLALTPSGDIIIADGYTSTNGMLLRMKAPLPGLATGDFVVASDDGKEAYVFNDRGRHLATKDALLGVDRYQFGYDAAGRLTTITGVNNQVTTIHRDAAGAPTSIVAPTGQTTTLELDAEGYLWRVTNPASETTTLEYHPGTGLLSALIDPLARRHEFDYDADGRLTRDTNPAGGFKELSPTPTSSGHNVTITTAMGRVRSHLLESRSDGGKRRVHTGFDGLSTVVEIGPNSTVSMTRPDGTVVSTEASGDARFGMQSPIVGKETTVTPLGRTKQVTRSRSVVLAAPENPLNITSATNLLSVNGDTFSEVFDKATRTIVGTSPEGRQSTITLTADGQVQRLETPGVLPIDMAYYSDGRLHTRTQGSRTWTYTYEDNGWLTTATDPLLQTTSFLHDPVGRVTQVTRADSEILATSYHPGGKIHTVTPPGRTAHTFSYTSTDRLDGYLAPAAGGDPTASSWSHDLDGLLTSSARPGEPATTFTRDPSTGRLTQVALPLGMGTLSYSYNPTTGKVASVTGPAGISLAYGYDGALLRSRTWTGTGFGGGSRTVQWIYNNDFRIQSETVNGGAALSFDYDDDGRLTQVGGLTLSNHPQSGLYTGSSIGVVSDTIAHDSYGSVQTYVAQAGSSALFDVTYTPDARGRIDTRTETLLGQTHTYEYEYDLAGRLTDVYRDGVLAAHYDYDPNGNRLARTSPAGTESGTYDDQDRILTYGTKTYDVSPAGDVTSVTDTATGDTMTLAYDARGNLRQVELPDGTDIDYLVDGEGHRVWKRVNGANVQGFLYRSELQPAAELDGAGNVVARFVYGQERNVPDLMIKGGVTYRILTDHLGSPRLVVNTATGAVAQRMDFDEFGRVLSDTNPGFQPFGFAGGLYDRDTGLVRFGARDYDAETGRWTTKDPIGFNGGDALLYAYAGNDPINRVDPQGKASPCSLMKDIYVLGLGYYCAQLKEPRLMLICGGLAILAGFGFENWCEPPPPPPPPAPPPPPPPGPGPDPDPNPDPGPDPGPDSGPEPCNPEIECCD